ncbi:MAG: isopenicillin N synthase family oxygenase [Sphingomonadales bacterium]|nr:isopenicillin N synthase family oxygenase [Sphingomonadales bacterium]
MTSRPDLPIVDITGLASARSEDRLAVARALDRACAGSGFLYIQGEPLRNVPFARLWARAKAYFALDHAAKMRSYIGLSENHSGYVPEGEEQFDEGTHDRKEAYDIGCEYPFAHGRRPLLGPNLWPDMPGFREDVLAYYEAVAAIGRQLFGGFALALGLREDHFEGCLKHPPSQLRLIHYPHQPEAEDREGIGAHTDYECFTLLFATAPGLQVQDSKGAWIDVPLLDGTLIVNIGDMMEVLSDGRYRATRHRVRKVAQERYSFPLFHACDYDHVIAPVVPARPGRPPCYAPIASGEHLFRQTARTFAYLKRRGAGVDAASPPRPAAP